MSYLLQISSDDMESGQTTDNFSVGFSPAIRVNGNWEIALQQATLWYSWYNISAQYGNQTFRYYNGSVWKNITITPGLYGLNDLNTFLQAQMLTNGDYLNVGGVNTFFITLAPD